MAKAKQSALTNDASETEANVVDVTENKTTTTKSKSGVKPIIPKEIDVNQLIPVINGFHGMLIYKSARSGEIYQWEEFNEVQDIELKELRNAKSSNKAFFVNNWFMFDEEYDWVIDYLGLRQYYKNAISIDGFDEIYTKKPEEIAEIVSKLSSGQKSSLSYKTRELIANKKIDSFSVITALETALDTKFIEG